MIRRVRSKPPKPETPREKKPVIEPKRHRGRIWFLMVCFVLPYIAVGARLVMFQLDPNLHFSDEELFHIREVFIDRPRGKILDTNGRVLAANREVPSLSVNPSAVTNAAELAQWLAPRLGEKAPVIYEKLTRTSADGDFKKFVWLKRRMTETESAQLGDIKKAPDAAALMLQPEPVRMYPEGQLAAHVLGFANREGVGSEGIEAKYDSYLRSNPGRQVSRTDRQRNLMGFRTIEFEPPSGGDDVQLTIDSAIQYSLEQELDRAIADNNAKRAMGMLMDPRTGAVLALATRPAFDPNNYMNEDAALRRNGAVIDMFEPGSAFKIVTTSGAIESGLIAPDDPIDCMGGRFNPYGHLIHDTHSLGVVTYAHSFAVSSNIATIKVAALLGPERLEHWVHKFGFSEPTTLGLPGEEKGLLSPRAKWSRLTMGAIPIGQEISVTIAQLARAFSVIANGGFRVEPYLVDNVRSPEGAVRWKHQSPERDRVLSAKTSKTMRELCYGVVASREATGYAAAIPEYRVGGKTGTAQIAKPGGGGYYDDRYTAVFAGFAPVNDPRVTCVIVVQEPMQKSHYGGFVSGPVFKKVVREALVRLHVPPDPDPNASRDPAEPPMDDANAVRLAAMEPSDRAPRLDSLELLTSAKDDTNAGPRLPNFIGKTKREAKEIAVSLGIPWDPQGAGRVISQDPPAGTRLDEVRQCTLVFATGSSHDIKL